MITPYGFGSAGRSADFFLQVRREMTVLQRQLATGEKADSYGGLGPGRRISLDARGKLATLDGYGSVIERAETRVALLSGSLEALAKAAGDTTKGIAANGYAFGSDGKLLAQAGARDRLALAIDALNAADVNGRYLFSGRAHDTAPVENLGFILDGDPATGRAGLRQLVDERRQADRGPMAPTLPAIEGRLQLTRAGTSVALSEGAGAEARSNFGFRILGAESSSGAIAATTVAGSRPTVSLSFGDPVRDGDAVQVTVNGADGSQDTLTFTARRTLTGAPGEFAIGANAAASAANLQAALGGAEIASVQSRDPPNLTAAFSGGAPASATLDVASRPADGDTVRITLGLRDGTQTTVALTARTTANPAIPGEFTIGATPAATADALAAALGRAVRFEADSTLAAASAELAATDFFDGSATGEPHRVAGPPFDAASGFAPVSSGRTVIWYKGDDAGEAVRSTSTVRVDETLTLGFGAQANEPAIRDLLAGLAAFATASFADTPADRARFEALAERVRTDLAPPSGSPTVETIAGEIAVAAATMADAKARHAATEDILRDAVAGVEKADENEVAVGLLALQTRLQASYQTTSMLSQLSLVNYL